jgi:hypothetical protein
LERGGRNRWGTGEVATAAMGFSPLCFFRGGGEKRKQVKAWRAEGGGVVVLVPEIKRGRERGPRCWGKRRSRTSRACRRREEEETWSPLVEGVRGPGKCGLGQGEEEEVGCGLGEEREKRKRSRGERGPRLGRVRVGFYFYFKICFLFLLNFKTVFEFLRKGERERECFKIRFSNITLFVIQN